MNREIKFRIWEIYEKRFVEAYSISFPNMVHVAEGDQYYLCNNLNASEEHKKYLSEHNVEIRDEFILTQFTGLKDANGVEIYEGDIVKYTKRVFDDNNSDHEYAGEDKTFHDKVVFEGGGFQSSKSEFGWEGEGLINLSECEVIGNIFEHPELIK